jgi:hypothetical protein
MLIPASHHRPFVLLTGATGLVGGLVMAELLRREIPVAILVRANRRQSATERVEGLMQRLEERYGHLLVRPVVLSGDLCVPGLGLSEFDTQWLAVHCGSVIHSAANLLFRPANEHPDNEPWRTNVDGTRHLLNLTTTAGIKEWHYVSTAYIAGLRSGQILENETDVGQQFGNDYERSKTMAEQMLRARCEHPGADQSQNPLIRPAATFSPCEGEKGQIDGDNFIQSLTVYRPSIVIDLHPTSSMRSDQTINSAFTMFQALSQRFGLPKRGEWIQLLGFEGHERKNIVTVDWVARMITQIYRRPALHGQTYHLTSPAGLSATELEDGFRAACEQSGTKYPDQRRKTEASFNQQAAPFVAAFTPYFRDDPLFDRANISRAIDVCGESDVPLLTVDQLRDFCLRQTKPAAPVSAVTSEPSAWSEFLAAKKAEVPLVRPVGHLLPLREGEGRLESPPETEDNDSIIGLMLSGAGGGQWKISDVHGHVRVQVAPASTASVRWIATASTFDELMNGRLSVRDAIESGQLMFEDDAEPEVDSKRAALISAPSSGLSATISSCLGEKGHIERFSGLIARIQCHRSGPRGLKSEVAHVG